MPYPLSMAPQLAVLHQHDLRARADYARLVAQTRATHRVSDRKETPMQTLMQTLTTLTLSLVLHPRAAIAVAVALALVTALLLGPDGVEAGLSTSPSRPHL